VYPEWVTPCVEELIAGDASPNAMMYVGGFEDWNIDVPNVSVMRMSICDTN
jgi:hypothetical protein